jgi:hypothetical protein
MIMNINMSVSMSMSMSLRAGFLSAESFRFHRS